jgi:ribA/ribD-fused uncharacterized protein
MNGDILQFQGEYRWLSNFAPAEVWLDGDEYPSVEHAYQAAKSTDEGYRDRVWEAIKPGDAKRIGRTAQLRRDWERVKVPIMLDLLRQKYSLPEYKQLLLATGSCQLVEGNVWGDTFWGVCRGAGQNQLGKLIMQIREELRLTENL